MTIRHKTVALEVKELGDDTPAESEGTFVAYASVFGNKDSYGDVVEPGAFTKSLKEWGDKGLPIPLYYGHDMTDPNNNLGFVKASEDSHGLKVEGHIDLSHGNGPVVYNLLKTKRLAQLSFGYEVVKSEPTDKEGLGRVISLKEVTLHEVSLVPLGANPLTEVLDVKAGRVLSKRNEADLKEAQRLIQNVLDSSAGSENADGGPALDDGPLWTLEAAKYLTEILEKGAPYEAI